MSLSATWTYKNKNELNLDFYCAKRDENVLLSKPEEEHHKKNFSFVLMSFISRIKEISGEYNEVSPLKVFEGNFTFFPVIYLQRNLEALLHYPN